MVKIKPSEILAKRFQIPATSAKYFLGRVQKSFKKEKPPEDLILEFIEGKKLKSLPSPYQVAALMNEYGLWSHPLNAEPPTTEDEPDLY